MRKEVFNDIKQLTKVEEDVCAIGILLVRDILDIDQRIKNMFVNGHPVILGVLGWLVFVGGLAWAAFCLHMYISKNMQIRREIVSYKRKKDKCRIEIEGVKTECVQIKMEYRNEMRNLNNDHKLIFDILGKKKKEEIKRIDEKRDKELEERLKRCKESQDELKKNNEMIEVAECKLVANKETFRERIRKSGRFYAAVLVVIILDYNYMITAAQELKETVGKVWETEVEIPNETPTEKTPEENGDLEKADTESISEEKMRDNLDYNFILEKEQLDKTVDAEINAIVLENRYTENRENYKKFIVKCKEGEIAEKFLENASEEKKDLESLLDEIAEDLEKPFLDKIEKGKSILSQAEWEERGPRSSEQEEIINERISVLKKDESIPIRRKIYYQLANDFQRMGKECLIQNKGGDQVYYYYSMSIYSCYCALQYEETDEKNSDKEILKYVRARYKDIADNEKAGVSAEIVSKTERIYLLLIQE